jgi:alpha-beta hydrolase superfamily lysophospholipase
MAGSRRFFDHAGSTDKKLKMYEGAFQGPLDDIHRDISQ